MYWAVTIVTTTGYGDILSETEFEKCKSCWFRNGNKATHGYAESSEGVSGRLAPSVCMYVFSRDSSKSVALGTHDRSLGGKHVAAVSKQMHLVVKRFRLKSHQNNQFLLFVDVSVSIRDLHQEESGTRANIRMKSYTCYQTKRRETLKRDPTPSYKRKLLSILSRLKDEGKN